MKIFYRCVVIWATVLALTTVTLVTTLKAIEWIAKLRAHYIVTYYEAQGFFPVPNWDEITKTDAYQQATQERRDHAKEVYDQQAEGQRWATSVLKSWP